MTRISQKEKERGILDAYFRAAETQYVIQEEREHPDFIVLAEGRRFGVEIIEYHVPQMENGGFTRRQVESGWERLREYVVEFRETHSEIDGLSVWLEFRSMRVPSTREVPGFVDAVAAEVAGLSSDVGPDEHHYHKVCSDSPAILQQYLSSIRIRVVSCYMEWDWNHSAGSVGTSDEEMLAVLEPKLSGYRAPDGIDSSHLVVAGWGGRMSEIISPLCVEQFAHFHGLNDALHKGPFDAVAILCFMNLIWERGKGWRELPRE